MPVGRVDRMGGADDEKQDDADFYDDDDTVKVGRFLDSDHQQRRHDEDYDDGGKIEHRGDVGQGAGINPSLLDLFGQRAKSRPARPGFQRRRQRRGQINQLRAAGGRQLRRQVDSKIAQERDHVPRPADGHGNGSHGVFQNQVPPNDPGKEFPQCRVAVGIGAAGHGHQRGKFAVTKRRENGRDTRGYVRKNHGRPRILGGDSSGEHENPGADNRADPQSRQIEGAQGAF